MHFSCGSSGLPASFGTFESLLEVRGINTLPDKLMQFLVSPNSSVKELELMGTLPNVLKFSGLDMRSLPPAVKSLFKKHRDDIVTSLDLSKNRLQENAVEDILRALGCPKDDGLPSALCGYLEHVDLSSNEMNKIPDLLFSGGMFSNLAVLNLAENPLLEVDNAKQKYFYFGSDVSEVIRERRLSLLRILDGGIAGSIPSELGPISAAGRINNNEIVGSISSQLGCLARLSILDLGNNKIDGSIPSQLGLLTNLNMLFMNNNKITGSIPSQLGLLTNLSMLHLNDNGISGSIPSQLGLLTLLNRLFLQDNALIGSTPSELGLLTEIDWSSILTTSGVPSLARPTDATG